MTIDSEQIKDSVKDYYGKTLSSSDDLQTDACCTAEDMPDFLKPILSNVHDEVLMRYYGCGLVLPEALDGTSILDLGCGAGRDVYALAQLVGENGQVVGVDMTDEQLEVAKQYQDYHAEKFGFGSSNVAFHKAYIEALDQLPYAEDSFDIIVSNCVINLSTDKLAVLKQAKRLLKAGGELYFSDVYADRRIPEVLQKDEELYGECLSGALYWRDFIHLAQAAGFADVRLVKSRSLKIENPALQEKLGDIAFWSTTYRLFAIDELEQGSEDFGHTACYQGGIIHHESTFELEHQQVFEKDAVTPISGNTYQMLKQSRFAEFFELTGDFENHKGSFIVAGSDQSQISSVMPFSDDSDSCCSADTTASTTNSCC